MRHSVLAATAVVIGLLGVPVLLLDRGDQYCLAVWALREWVAFAGVGWFLGLNWLTRRAAGLLLRTPGNRLDARTAGSLSASPIKATATKLSLRARASLLLVGLTVAGWLIAFPLPQALARSTAYAALTTTRKPGPALVRGVRSSDYLRQAVERGLFVGCPLLLFGLAHFAQLYRLLPGRKRGTLPPYPDDPGKTQLVLGELHDQDGSPSDNPRWLVLPEKGMCTGILVCGSTGSGKTAGLLEPMLAQLIGLHQGNDRRKLGGLVIDAKGNGAHAIERWCCEVGREKDFYRISLPDARINVLNRPELSSAALAGAITDAIENVQGKGNGDRFWMEAGRERAMQALRAIRLADCRPATMADLYRVSTSEEALQAKLGEARARAEWMTAEQRQELESLEYWATHTLATQDPKLKASIAAGLNAVCSLFDEPTLRRSFCPLPHEETFPGFDNMIRHGKVVVVSLPETLHKSVSRIVATLIKLSFQDAVMTRLARAETTNSDLGRSLFFVADEYDQYVTKNDASFLSKCREAQCCNIIAVQTYPGLTEKIGRESVQQLLGNLRTKAWLGLEDNETAEEAAKLCGRRDTPLESRTLTESSQRAAYSFVDGTAIAEGNSSATASTALSYQERYLFSPMVFTHLKAFQAIMKVFDGSEAHEACVVCVRPRHRESDPSAGSKPL